MAKKYNQGLFKVRNKDKYFGDSDRIIYRSGWELAAFIRLDNDPSVIKWGSEQIVIPYFNPVDQKIHRYFPDLYVEKKDGQIYIIEIKPSKETKLPQSTSNISRRRLLKETLTYNINRAKWIAAERFCRDKRWTFIVATENELFKNGR